LHDPVGHDTGIGHPEWAGPAERVDDFGDGLGDRCGSGRLRGQQFDPVTDQLSGVQVNDCALDAAAADVDSEPSALGGGRRFF
jgi:hypothetical protein